MRELEERNDAARWPALVCAWVPSPLLATTRFQRGEEKDGRCRLAGGDGKDGEEEELVA